MRIFRGVVLALVPTVVIVGIGLPASVREPAHARPVPSLTAETRPLSAHLARAGRADPVLAKPSYARQKVTLRGVARPRAAVRVQKLVGKRWRHVRTVRASRTGSFRTVLTRPAVTRSYRAVVAGRGSAVRRIAPAPPAPPVTRPGEAPKPPAPDACGARPQKADGSYYSCTFADDFDGSALDGSRWLGQAIPGNGGDLCVAASPETIRVAGGSLRLTAMRTTATTQCPARPDGTRASYAASTVTTWNRFGQQYGRFEARIRAQDSAYPGLHEAFWLWPDARYTSDKDWPATGEIDIAETYSVRRDLAVPFLHYSADVLGPVPGLNTAWTCAARRGEWHVYTLDWTVSSLTITIDGRTCLVATAAAASYRKPFIINLSQYLGSGPNVYDGRAQLPATMEVDYVRAWR